MTGDARWTSVSLAGGDGSERSVWGEPALLKALIVFILSLSFCTPGLAMTPAGTVIPNRATLTWDAGSSDSNTVDVVVAQVAGCEVAPETGGQTGFAGSSVLFPTVVSNTGNGTDTFGLEVSSSAGWPVTIYCDDNRDGVHQTTETTVLTETGPLPMNGQAACVLAVELPAGVSGTSTVTLTARSHYDPLCLGVAAFTIQAILPVAADFSASPTTGPAPLSVAFTDLSSGGPTAWEWQFGDGGVSSEQNPRHTYASPGIYTVTLTITGPGGPSAKTVANLVTVTPAAPTADFSAAPVTGPSPLAVTFTDLSSGSPTSWLWDFGDGGSSVEQSPTHLYAIPGVYAVALTISDGVGSDTETKDGCVTVLTPSPLVADFSASPLRGKLPLLVEFTDQSIGSPLAWSWDFGDGGSSSDQDPVYEYQTAGHQDVSLTVTDAFGMGTETKPKLVAVSFRDVPIAPEDPADFWAVEDVLGCVDAAIVAGYPDGTYRPATPVDRGQMATYIARSVADGEASVPSGPAEATFTDLPTDHWAFRYVEYAAAQDIVVGYWDGTYRPEVDVTRGQMGVFIARGVVAPTDRPDLLSYTPPDTPTFPDVPADYWSYKFVEYLAAEDVVRGYPDGSYRPEEVVTRDQMAVYIAKAFSLLD